VRDRLLRDGYVILAVVFVGLRLFAVEPWADSVDAYAYWTTRDGVFYDAAATGQIGAYLYSPAFAQALAPLVWLPIAVFTAMWTALNFVALWWLLGRLALPSMLFLPIPFEIISGNVHLLYAVAIVAGFRYSASWALMILTKVTPGIGIAWFVVRREWRALVVALGATAVIAAVSFALDQSSWETWIGLLRTDLGGAGQGTIATEGWYLPIALLPRLVAATLALPVVWLNGLAVLAAVIPLARERSKPPASA
jgi:hypothetical protein